MFTNLAFIDWLALVFTAVLLAAASAATVIAVATSSDRRKSLFSFAAHRGSNESAEETSVETSEDEGAVAPTWEVPPAPSLRPLRAEPQPTTLGPPAQGSHVTPEPKLDADAGVAARAAKLSGRPVPESPALHSKRRVQSVVADRTPAHAKTFAPTIIEGRSGVANADFDRTEGFKARNPGFFEDPMGRHDLRYWDGYTWTEYVKEHGERFTDPL